MGEVRCCIVPCEKLEKGLQQHNNGRSQGGQEEQFYGRDTRQTKERTMEAIACSRTSGGS